MNDELAPYTLYKIASFGGLVGGALLKGGLGLAKGVGKAALGVGNMGLKGINWGVRTGFKHPMGALTIGGAAASAPSIIGRQVNNVSPFKPYMG